MLSLLSEFLHMSPQDRMCNSGKSSEQKNSILFEIIELGYEIENGLSTDHKQ
jgi:hypothetical protein